MKRSKLSERFYRLLIALGGLASVVLVGWVDLKVGATVSPWLLYVPPIVAVAWYVGGRSGVLVAIAAGFLMLFARVANGLPPEGELWAALWDTSSVLVVLAVTPHLTARVHGQLLHESLLARQDALTHIPNRLHFWERLPEALSSAAARRSPVTLALIELRGIDYVNDRFGGTAGDLLLRRSANVLLRTLGSEDLVGRIRGTTFAAVLPGRDVKGARELLEKVRNGLISEINLYDRPISVAIAAVSTDHPSPESQTLLDRTIWLLRSIRQERGLHPFRVIGEQEVTHAA